MQSNYVKFVVLFALIRMIVDGHYSQLYETATDCIQVEIKGVAYESYFDSLELKCKPCAQNSSLQKTNSNGLGCICAPNCRLVEDFGGDIVCEKCSDQETVSEDGWECIKCAKPSICKIGCPNEKQISVERNLDGSWPNNRQEYRCMTCKKDTFPNANHTSCDRCNQILSVSNASNCLCPDRYQEASGICFLPATGSSNMKSAFINQVSFEDESFESKYFRDNYGAALAMCGDKYKNRTACQLLANMCVLILYNKGYYYADTVCTVYLELYESRYQESTDNSQRQPDVAMPMLYYSMTGPGILRDTSILRRFKLGTSHLEFVAALYSMNGSFLGFQDVSGGLLQFCRNSQRMLDAGYEFGVHYVQRCEISVRHLWDKIKNPTIFYEIWMRLNVNGRSVLYEVPVVLSDYISPTGLSNNKGINPSAWQLFRRFFLVDNISGVRASTATATPVDENLPDVDAVRYAESISISINLQPDSNYRGGLIFPPCLRVNYSVASIFNYLSDDKVPIQFEVIYKNERVQTRHDVFVAVGVLGILALLWSLVQTASWGRRAGKFVLDLTTFFKWLLILIGFLGEIMFVLMFCVSLWWLVCFKAQKHVIIFGENPIGHVHFSYLIVLPFVFQAINILHLIVCQVTVDIFFVDWEPSRDRLPDRLQGLIPGAAMWRTYFVMRQWNQLQAKRKVNPAFQMIASLFLLSVVGLGNLATEDPSAGVKIHAGTYRAETTCVFRFACFGTVYLLVAFLQIIWGRILEHIRTNKIRHIVDLCSVANISVFVLENGLYGHYIHGRSPNCRSDTTLRDMYYSLLREKTFYRRRGLLPQQRDQRFQMAITRLFKVQFDRILLPILTFPHLLNPVAEELRQESISRKEVFVTPDVERSVSAYALMNRFLRGFIEHEFTNYDYVLKERTLVEEILNLELESPKKLGFFYQDSGCLFHKLFFYGHETKILIFEILLFGVINLNVSDYVLSGLVVYFVSGILVSSIRKAIGRVNVAKKSLVDKRFLI